MKTHHVVIGTPCLSGDLCVEYLSSLMHSQQVASQYGITVDLSVLRGDTFIDKARNNIAKQFLDNEPATALFFIDADQGWDADAFVRMVMDDHDIVAGAVPKKSDQLEFNCVNLDAAGNGDCYIENGMLRAKHVGTGFMRITRAALEKFVAAYPERYRPGDGSSHEFVYNIFDCGPRWAPGEEVGQYWGEDLYFCQRWVELGGHLWIDPVIEFTHTGRKTYRGNLYKFLEANGAVRSIEQGVRPELRIIENEFEEDAA